MKHNPYNYNMPVGPEMFYGRDAQLSAIVRQLLAATGDSIALIGGRRMGKTSLLEALERQLLDPQSGRQANLLPLPIFLDFSGEGIGSPHAFFNRVIEESQIRWAHLAADDSLALTGQATDGAALGPALRRLLETWGRRIANQYGQQPRLILLLDECEEIVGQPWVTDLYGLLRYLLDGRTTRPFLKVVMAGSHGFLTQVRQRGSPLENILQYHRLYAFNRAATQDLIDGPTGGLVDAAVAAAVWQESGGHPFLAQYLLHALWEHGLAQGTAADVGRWAIEFPQARADFFKWLAALGKSGAVAYGALLQVDGPLNLDEARAALDAAPADMDQTLEALHYHGLIQKDDQGRYQVSSGMFRRWFARNHAPGREAAANPTTELPARPGDKTTAGFRQGYALLIDVSADRPAMADVLARIDQVEGSLGHKLDDLKRGQRILYQRITPVDQQKIEAILHEVREQRWEQSVVETSVEAILHVLVDIQQKGLPVNDAELEQTLADIYREVVSGLDLQQQFELTLPVIPFLLQYRLALGAEVDLGAVWKDLVARLKRTGK